MLNKVILIGYVGGDAEVRVLENGSKMARFSLATNENFIRSDGNPFEHTEWHTIVAWRSVAETAEKIATKGAEIYVEGSIRSRQNTDIKAKTSSTVYEIVAKMIRRANDVEELPIKKPEAIWPEIIIDPDGLPF